LLLPFQRIRVPINQHFVNPRWRMNYANVLCVMQKCQEKGYTMGVYPAILAEHFSEEQPREMILSDASFRENAALRTWRGSLAHHADMRSA
jgi:hypothetical protein